MKKLFIINLNILFLLITTSIFSQTLSEKENTKYIKTIDSLIKKKELHKYSYPDMSACGGALDGYFYNGKLVYIDATYQGELGYSNRKIYLKDSLIYKIIYREHFAEWEKYYKNYPDDKYVFDASKMTYSDTLYTIILTNPIRFIKTSKKKIISKKINNKLLTELLTCTKEMKTELESMLIKKQ